MAERLALKFTVGDRSSYAFRQVFTGALLTGGQTQPVAIDLRAGQVVHVTAVDPDGTAAIDVELIDISGTSNGQALPPLGTQRSTLRVAPDGRILGGGLAGPSAVKVTLPAADQTFAILPPAPVKAGATWAVDFERPNAFGAGAWKIHADSRLLRYEQVAGVRTAVVASRLSTPFDVELDPAKLGQPAGVALHESGTVTAEDTTWVDPAAGRVVKGTSTSRFDVTVAVNGTASYRLSGSQSVDLSLQP